MTAGEPDHRPRRAGRDAAGRLDAGGRAPRVADAMTMRTALRTSSNRAAVRCFQTVGLEQAMSDIDRLNIGDDAAACPRSRSAPARSRCSR